MDSQRRIRLVWLSLFAGSLLASCTGPTKAQLAACHERVRCPGLCDSPRILSTDTRFYAEQRLVVGHAAFNPVPRPPGAPRMVRSYLCRYGPDGTLVSVEVE